MISNEAEYRLDSSRAPHGPEDVAPRAAQRVCPTELFKSPLNLFCVTLYNEGLEPIRATLASIVRAIQFYHRHAPNKAPFSTICVVADGVERIDPEVVDLLMQGGAITPGPWKLSGGLDLHYSVHDSCELLRRLGESAQFPGIVPIRFIFCIKERNAGKLQSHEIFFGSLCPQLNPTFCYQVDTGTVVYETAVAEIVGRLEQRPEIGALAPRIITASPDMGSEWLQVWQYFDFAYRQGVSWPFEVAAGFLSVVPGQTSAYRWAALSSAGKSGERIAEDQPVAAYLQGVGTKTPLTHLRYLAEDRVIGAHLVLARDKAWELDHLPSAGTITDSCDGMWELLKQRRRWNNSSAACRAWLAYQTPRVLRRSDRTLQSKLSFSAGVLAQLVVAFREILAPGLLLALVVVLWKAAVSPASPLQGSLAKLFWLVSAADVALNCMIWRDRSKARLLPGARVRAVVGCVAALAYLALVMTFPLGACLILLLPAIATVPTLMALGRGGTFTILRMQLSPIISAGFFSAILCYSVFKLDDVSWGTKGLNNPQLSGRARSLRYLRNLVFPSWIAVNVGLGVLAFNTTGAVQGSLNAVVAVSCIVDGVLALVAIAHLLRHKVHRMRFAKPAHATSPRPLQ